VNVPSVDAACVDPEVLEFILGCLFSAELQLSIPVLLFFISAAPYVLKENLETSPSVRENSILRDALPVEICQDESVGMNKVKKSHDYCTTSGCAQVSRQRK
jgi:hypothetical protein